MKTLYAGLNFLYDKSAMMHEGAEMRAKHIGQVIAGTILIAFGGFIGSSAAYWRDTGSLGGVLSSFSAADWLLLVVSGFVLSVVLVVASTKGRVVAEGEADSRSRRLLWLIPLGVIVSAAVFTLM
ncbi:hypothetical protein I6E29_00645 [Arcanobacterium haemolyticum]|nr:hypothetical protein [Arcanobacterium haemolyticum]